MNAPAPIAPQIDQDSPDLSQRAQAILRLEAIVATWEESQRLTVQALKSGIEDLNKEALRHLIRSLKEDPAAAARLRACLQDPLVYGVLDFHGLLKPSLQSRVERALEEVRPFMATHGGNVELVAIRPPDTVEIRLVGACHGCPASGQTLSEGVEKSIRAQAPEILHIHQVSRGLSESARGLKNASESIESTVHFISPFARNAKAGWVDAVRLDEIPLGGILEQHIGTRSVLLHRHRDGVSCIDNACAHLGMPLEMGRVEEGVITCSYHGFRYLLETGECLTAPEVQLKVHAVRVLADRVQVRLED